MQLYSRRGSKWWGDPVTLTGSYMDPIAAGNLLGFYDRGVRADSAVDGGDGFATQTVFTVPEDGRGAYPLIQSHGKTPDIPNGDLPFIHLYPRGIPQFTTIRDIVYAPQTGHIWVAADSVVEEIDIFQHDPSIVTTLSSYTKPYISRVTTDGRILVVDGVSGVSQIDQIDVSSGAVTLYAHTTDTSHTPNFTRSILPRGIAVDPDGTIGYIADTIYGDSHGRVIRFPEGNDQAITDEYGGFISWIFPDPCGLEVGLTGNVYVSNTGGWFIPWIGEITDANNSYNFGYIDDIAYDLEIDRDVSTSSYDRLYYTYQPETMAYNKNTIAGFSKDSSPARYHGADIIADSGFLSVEPMWNYSSWHHHSQRVILDNEGQNFPYDSIYQSQDRIVRLDIPGWSGVKLYLTLIDPPDYSPYAPLGGWSAKGSQTAVPPYEANDNEIWDNPLDDDYGLTTDADGTLDPSLFHPVTQLDVTPGSDNMAVAYLKLPKNYSGDNWQVKVQKETAFGVPITDEVPSYSSVYTAWKRVFVERDKMFRRGGLLYNDAAKDATSITIYKQPDDSRWDDIHPNDKIAIFDSARPYEGPHDEAYVGTITQVGSSTPHQMLITLVTTAGGSTPYHLDYSYTASPADESTHWPTFTPVTPPAGTCAAVGVVYSTYSISGETITDTSDNQINGTGSAFYDADTRDLLQPFDDAYLEIICWIDGEGAVPYLPKAWFDMAYNDPNPGPMEYFSQIWFKNYQQADDSLPHGNVPHNYFHLMGVSDATLLNGVSNAYYDYSYIFIKSIEADTPSNQQVGFEQETTDHELVHQFYVNYCTDLASCSGSGDPLGRHDYRNWWLYDDPPGTTGCPPSNPCIMQPGGADLAYSKHKLCLEDLLLGDPNCTDTPRSGAIRTDADPQ